MTRKHSCGRRGRRDAERASAAISTQATPNSSSDTALRVLSGMLPTTGQCSVSKKYQMDPQSAPRLALNR